MPKVKQLFDAVFAGFRDSLGGLYNLIGVKVFDCLDSSELVKQCL